MAYKLKLVEWGLSNFVDNFDEEGIDDLSFPLLDKETINKLFPKCGPRLVFQKQYQQYKESQQCQHIERLSSATSYSEETLETDDTFIFEPEDQLLEILQAQSTPQRHSLEEAGPSKDFDLELGLLPEIAEPGPSKKQKVDQVSVGSVFPQGLETVLKKYVDGKLVVLNKERLNNNLRQKLVRCTINELIATYGIRIKAEIFQKTSQEIEHCFVNERADSYYVPYCASEKPNRKSQADSDSVDSVDEEKKGVGPKGKLWNKYVNVKHALKNADSFKVNKSTKRSPSPEVGLDEEHQINFLKIATEPFTKILEAWENSLKLRRKLYVNVGLNEVFKEFPCLKLNNGIELIESDFNHRYPDKVDIIYDTWPKVSAAILSEAQERKINLCPDDSSCEKSIRAILSLPYLCPPVTLKKSRKGSNWRPTRSEIQDSFFSLFPTYEDLELRIQSRRSKLNEYGVTLQPFAAVVGELNKPEAFYIIVDDVRYKIGTTIRTLELLFKLFHALDVAYPPESEHVWLVIEELIFKIKPSKKSPAASTVIADLKFFLTSE